MARMRKTKNGSGRIERISHWYRAKDKSGSLRDDKQESSKAFGLLLYPFSIRLIRAVFVSAMYHEAHLELL